MSMFEFQADFLFMDYFALNFEVKNESILEWGCNKNEYFTDAPPLPDSHSVRWITLYLIDSTLNHLSKILIFEEHVTFIKTKVRNIAKPTS